VFLESNGCLNDVVITLTSLLQPPGWVKQIVGIAIADHGNVLVLELSFEPTIYVVGDEDLAIEKDPFAERVADALRCLVEGSHCFVKELKALVRLKCTDNLRARYGDRLVHDGE